MKLPTDLAAPPGEADLFLNGRTDAGVPQLGKLPLYQPAPVGAPPPPPPPPAAVAPAGGGSAERQPTGFEKDYGHVL
jgi:pilus assembly protein CpaC